MKIFLDSDVVISALISSNGASFYLIKIINEKNIQGYISDISKVEIEKVIKRMNLSLNLFKDQLKYLKISKLLLNLEDYPKKYKKYVNDPFDGHIVAGCKYSKSKFLITYNQKDYNQEQIKRDFDIIVMTPGKFLQYLRSQD